MTTKINTFLKAVPVSIIDDMLKLALPVIPERGQKGR